MTQPTFKQVKFANDLGIANADTMTKEELTKAISEKTGKPLPAPKKSYENPSNRVLDVSQQTSVLQRTDKPHSYEFGKVGNRHKIYYNTIEELKKHIADLDAAGFTEAELTNPEDFGR